jgi:hypothetical protein
VRSDIWAEQPKPQPISLSRDKATLPSTWARFRFTTPAEGSLVSIEIVLLYQGKPLQAATYVSPVGAGLPGETPTLTTFALSGPDEPTDDLRPVDASLDGRKADLAHTDGRGGTVTIADVQQKLNAIEDRVSKVLGVPGAPDSFDDARAFELLVTLARIGTQLRLLLGPLELDDSSSINVRVNPETPVLPLELVYSGPAPREKGAKLCRHVDEPPALGEGCDLASTTIVCPYAFWGLSRSISRTIESTPTKRSRPWTQPSSPFSVLYASTDIADDGATAPTPSETVLASAKTSFQPVTRVTSWTAWRKAVRTSKPNLLVVLGHTLVEGGETRLYIGRKSSISRVDISAELLRADDSAPPLVLLIACATAVLGDVFGTLPGSLTANGAGAVVGTLSKIVGPQGAEATVHLLDSLHGAAPGATVGDAVAGARHTLVAQKRPIGLLLVSHGEMDTKAVP